MNVLTIIKKEFSRFFKDRRMLITILLPGILIYIVYSLMGTVFKNESKIDENFRPAAYVINMPAGDLGKALSSVLQISEEQMDAEAAKKKVEEGSLDLAIIFSENFDISVDGAQNSIEIYYNSANEDSSIGFEMVSYVLKAFEQPKFVVNPIGGSYDLATEQDFAASFLSTLIPMLMFALLASACVAVAPESIAGEKERGTMATMLITPVNRWEIALGKIISLSCFALLSGISSFLGVILSLPKLMGGLVSSDTVSFYNAGDYFMLFGIIISVVLVIISVFSVLSALSNSVKEAGAIISPCMIVIILLGLASMIITAPAIGWYFIPLLGSGLAMSGVMAMTASPLGVVFSILSNLVFAAALIVLLAFMFKSEKIMFKK
ncbi:MAG: ABC transporter permease [Clostridiales bacterium]|nr:ABC transporter permease [Clostridiales bacterium]